MSIGRTSAIALMGLNGSLVEVEADISSNLPGFVLIGLPDAALGEARPGIGSGQPRPTPGVGYLIAS